MRTSEAGRQQGQRFRWKMLLLVLPMLTGVAECLPAAPPRPATGPGSEAGYIAEQVEVFQAGSVTVSDSTRVWWYVPDVLRDGDSAPVVLYLHGYTSDHSIYYRDHIDHLARQGYVVVFPTYNAGLLVTDVDANIWVDRVIRNSAVAFEALGDSADLSQLYVYGHSAGAVMASVLEHNGGLPARGYVLAHPGISTSEGEIPGLVQEADWEAEAPATTGAVVMLTGEHDEFVPPMAAQVLLGYLSGTSSRVLWSARSDDHGAPANFAFHFAPMTDSQEDSLKWRFYWSALDQMLAGDISPVFDMGGWSDGTPVLPPELL